MWEKAGASGALLRRELGGSTQGLDFLLIQNRIFDAAEFILKKERIFRRPGYLRGVAFRRIRLNFPPWPHRMARTKKQTPTKGDRSGGTPLRGRPPNAGGTPSRGRPSAASTLASPKQSENDDMMSLRLHF